ncbi:MAG: EamA family transporter [Phascolarctobacterium sp.]|nr:EamA family transporter [Phascolarctobacterium sp.]
MNLTMFIPVGIIVISNVFYHMSMKSTPANINTFASLVITYLVASASSLAMYFLTAKNPSLMNEYEHLTWSSIVLGIAIIGLEFGFILMYKMGWAISAGEIVAASLLAIVLLIVGYFVYNEPITWQKILGIIICLFGLYLLSK